MRRERYEMHTRREAVIRVFTHELADMLRLPETMVVRTVYAEHDPASISIVVAGPQLEAGPS